MQLADDRAYRNNIYYLSIEPKAPDEGLNNISNNHVQRSVILTRKIDQFGVKDSQQLIKDYQPTKMMLKDPSQTSYGYYDS